MSRHAPSRLTRKLRGFTTIELLIAVIVVALLSALAFPTFMGSIYKSRRAEALTALGAVQLKQERWRANHTSYANDLTGAWPATGLNLPDTTPSHYYTIAIAFPAAATDTNANLNYEITATAIEGSSQVRDGDCAKLGVKMEAGNISYGSAAANGTIAYSTNNRCWSR